MQTHDLHFSQKATITTTTATKKNMITVTKIGCRANHSQLCFQIHNFFILPLQLVITIFFHKRTKRQIIRHVFTFWVFDKI